MSKPEKKPVSKSPRATASSRPVLKAVPKAAAAAPARAQVIELAHDAIARRAYELFESSGHPHGRDVEFWLEAERQLKIRREA